MSKFYKKLSIIFAMALAIILGGFSNNVLAADNFEVGINNLNNTQENSGKVGDQLLHPEKGWKRYDDTDKRIQYIGSYWYKVTGETNLYGGSRSADINKDGKIKFKFYGTKFRIVSYVCGVSGYNASQKADVYIDGVLQKSSINYNVTSGINQYLVYSSEGLTQDIHNISIEINDKNQKYGILLDAIDIDENGELKPYNENLNPTTILNIDPEKNKIHLNELVSANLIIDNIKDIAAEDVRITYDNTKLQFLGVEEVDGIKLVKQPDSQPGELRFIVASKGEKNIVNAKKSLLKLKFKGVAKGEALVDITKGRVSDGIEMEDNLKDEQCGQATIIIDENALKDVNNSGEFTLLDLAIDARHMGKDPKSTELAKYNTDIVANNTIDDADLLEIGKYMLENPNYKF